mgnify:CR=1 FL=1
MKLWLYSSGSGRDNEEIDLELIRSIYNPRPKFTFIPASFEESEEYYDEFVERFAHYTYATFNIFHVDQPFDFRKWTRAKESDLIYISGGNTYHLMASLRKSGIAGSLKKFLKKGGIIAGHSAGAIVTTPMISSAGYPASEADENFVNLQNLEGLDIVPFEIFPHYDNGKLHNRTLIRESIQNQHPIYALYDGTAIAIEGSKISFYGPIDRFEAGQKSQVGIDS